MAVRLQELVQQLLRRLYSELGTQQSQYSHTILMLEGLTKVAALAGNACIRRQSIAGRAVIT